MDKIIALKRRNNKIKNKKTFKETEQKTLRNLKVSLIVLSVVLVLSFLYLSSIYSQKSYLLIQEKEKNENLKIELQELTNKITDSNSIKSIQENELIKSMTEAQNKNYIDSQDYNILDEENSENIY